MTQTSDVQDARDTALVLLDFHRSTVERYEQYGPQVVPNTAEAVAAARRAGVPVVHVVANFRPGFPEISPNNVQLSTLLRSGTVAMDARGQESHPDLAPADGELVVLKKRVGAFRGTDLDLLLRAQGITQIVLAGIATSGIVLSTLRAAADLDYRIVVLSDCCSDADPLVHEVLLERVFPTQATVQLAREWTSGLLGADQASSAAR